VDRPGKSPGDRPGERPGATPGGSRGDEVPVERIHSGGHGATLTTAAVIVAAIAIAIVKPWRGPASGAAASPRRLPRDRVFSLWRRGESVSTASTPPARLPPRGEAPRMRGERIPPADPVRPHPDTATAGRSDDPFRGFRWRACEPGIARARPRRVLSVAATTVWRLTDASAPERIGPMRLSLTRRGRRHRHVRSALPRRLGRHRLAAGRYAFEVSLRRRPPGPPVGVDIIDVHSIGALDTGPAPGPAASPAGTMTPAPSPRQRRST
jgi:hypothetical protein